MEKLFLLNSSVPCNHTIKTKTFLLGRFHIPLLVLLSLSVQCQENKGSGILTKLSQLSPLLNENSGITLLHNSSLLYGINDSGGKNEIYGIDISTGDIKQVISIKNASNIDWEDLTSGGEILYIGDFGNNDNDRKDQTIYWVGGIAQQKEVKVSAFAKATTFQFEDQQQYPPKKTNRNYDVEAFFVLKNNFYLFTRNRSSGFDGTTKVYRVPKKTGLQIAEHVDSFITCTDKDDCQITSAAIDLATGKIALLSYNKVWILDNYTSDNFFNGKIQKIKLKHTSQKEAICFKDSNTLIISEEGSKKTGGNVYTLSLAQ